MYLAGRVTVVAALAIFAGLAPAQAAPFGHSAVPPRGVVTVGWPQERITQAAPNYVRPPPRFNPRPAQVITMPEHRHLPHGHHGTGNPAHPEEVAMPAE